MMLYGRGDYRLFSCRERSPRRSVFTPSEEWTVKIRGKPQGNVRASGLPPTTCGRGDDNTSRTRRLFPPTQLRYTTRTSVCRGGESGPKRSRVTVNFLRSMSSPTIGSSRHSSRGDSSCLVHSFFLWYT